MAAVQEPSFADATADTVAASPASLDFRTDEEVPSLAFGRWVEKRVGHFAADLESRVREAAEQNRTAIAQEPSRTAEILNRGTMLVEEIAPIVDDIKFHSICVERARLGHFCSVSDIHALDANVSDCEFFAWIQPVKAEDADTTGGSVVRPDADPDRWICGDALEVWERTEEPDQGPPGLTYRGVRDGDLGVRGFDSSISLSIAQDQLRMWMAVVRRRWGAATPVPNLPAEIFRKIKMYLRPVSSVLLQPMYLASVAVAKRQHDLELLLAVGLAHYLDSAHNLASKSYEVKGEWFTSSAHSDVRVPGNTVFTVMLSGKFFSVEGADIWPSASEQQLTSSSAWNTKRQEEVEQGDPFVRPSESEATYESITKILRTFFEAKGLKFTHDEEERQKFTISWA
ncbi:unnamed protein product [Amoebophrya sp. A120]|nr:unnamed protein product [Amoebophrya sp. A120]|eukprot:GSA120T00003213001.1